MKLAIDHPYYCSESNYYSNEAAKTYNTFKDFLDEYGDSYDVDLNLIFRFDVRECEDNPGVYSAYFFMIKQRKGLFCPIRILVFTEADEPQAINMLTKHWLKLRELWEPISHD